MVYILRVRTPEQPLYRGTERKQPYFDNTLDEQHPRNQLFFRYLEGMNSELLTFIDKDAAIHFVKQFNKMDVLQYEVLKIELVKSELASDELLLGYDISCAYFTSILISGFRDIHREQPDPPMNGNMYTGVSAALEMLHRYIKSVLNENGLVKNYQVGCLILETIRYIHDQQPAIIDNPSFYDVIQVSLVHID